MYVELACLDKMATEDETREAVFAASELHLNGVSVLPAYLAENKTYVPDMVLSSPVDFPHGTSTTKVREHACLSAIRRGANAIDLVMNHSLVVNRKMEKLLNDIESCMAVCRAHNASLRVMMEYRVYEQVGTELCIDTLQLIDSLGVEYVFPATGYRVDGFIDNLIMCQIIMQKSGLKTIANGSLLSRDQYELAKDSDVYGVRLTSVPVARDLFGV